MLCLQGLRVRPTCLLVPAAAAYQRVLASHHLISVETMAEFAIELHALQVMEHVLVSLIQTDCRAMHKPVPVKPTHFHTQPLRAIQSQQLSNLKAIHMPAPMASPTLLLQHHQSQVFMDPMALVYIKTYSDRNKAPPAHLMQGSCFSTLTHRHSGIQPQLLEKRLARKDM